MSPKYCNCRTRWKHINFSAKPFRSCAWVWFTARSDSGEKVRVMTAFKSGELQLLVATTVIEVGVDVPNASLMVIDHAERMGLAQLHQLRGRVGRGAAQSLCILLYQKPLSELARTRLKVIFENTDGFEIAQQDLQLRGPGELLGARQSGRGDAALCRYRC